MSKRILLVGQSRRMEFHESYRWLTLNFSCMQFDTIQLIPGQLVDPPSDIIFFQSVRGEFSDLQLNNLRKRFPLAGMCCIFGSWIEGETRSGHAMLGIQRVSSQQFVSLKQNVPWQSLPSTASADEQWMEPGYLDPSVQNEERRNLLILGYDRTLVDGLAMACSELGFAVTTGSPKLSRISSAVRYVIYDAARNCRDRLDDVHRLKRMNQETHLSVLVDFPRVDEKEDLIRAGAGEVIAKPFCLEQLFFEQIHALNS